MCVFVCLILLLGDGGKHTLPAELELNPRAERLCPHGYSEAWLVS